MTLLFGALLGAIIPVLFGLIGMVANKFNAPEVSMILVVLAPVTIICAVAGLVVSMFMPLWVSIIAGPVVIILFVLLRDFVSKP